MGSGSSAARRSRGRGPGAAPMTRSSSPGNSNSSDPCSAPEEEPPPSWEEGSQCFLGTRSASEHPPGTEEEDTDGDLDKALAEFEDVCEPQDRQTRAYQGRGSRREPPMGTCARVPGSSPTFIPSLDLEGTAARAAPGCAPRNCDLTGWGRGHCSTSFAKEQHGSRPGTDLFRRNTQDLENNNLSNKCHSRSSIISDAQGPILYDLSEEELMASIEREY